MSAVASAPESVTQNTGGSGSGPVVGVPFGGLHGFGFFTSCFAGAGAILRSNTFGLAGARRERRRLAGLRRFGAGFTATAPRAQPPTIGPVPLSSSAWIA